LLMVAMHHLGPWTMSEVFVLGALVAMVKAKSYFDVMPDPGIYAYAVLTVLITVFAGIDLRRLWDLRARRIAMSKALPRAHELGLIGCHVCGLVCREPAPIRRPPARAAARRWSGASPTASTRTWALLIAAFIVYIPANVLPIMRTVSPGDVDDNTILDRRRGALGQGLAGTRDHRVHGEHRRANAQVPGARHAVDLRPARYATGRSRSARGFIG
jgi:uncharacterized paraquat-inducible protein A